VACQSVTKRSFMNHRRYTFWLITAIGFIVLSCGGLFTCESPIEKERRELRESFESPEALIYRGLKISLRAIPTEAFSDTAMNEEKLNELVKERPSGFRAEKIYYLTLHTLGGQVNPVPTTTREVVLYVETAKEIYELRHELRKINEDDYPTVLENVFLKGISAKNATELAWYNSAYEHLILAALWTGSRVAPRPFGVYELSMVEPSQIKEPEIKLMAHLLRGAYFFGQDWPYMSEEEFSSYLEVLEREKESLIPYYRSQKALSSKSQDVDTIFAMLHAPGVLLRGIDRLKIEKTDDAVEDFDAFLKDAEKTGMANELVWFVGVYVSLKKDRTEDAIKYLDKLDGSPLFNDDEKKIIHETKGYLTDREPDKALTEISDKIFLARIMISYVHTILSQVDWHTEIQKSESGKKLLGIGGGIQSEYVGIQKAMSVDQIIALGQEAKQSVWDWFKSLIE